MKNGKYLISGVVVHGNGKGKTVGMPTANIDYNEIDKRVEKGVYASIVYLQSKQSVENKGFKEYIGVTNIGTRPSVDNDNKITIETNILDFNEDIYGEIIKIALLKKIRDIKKFEGLEEVKKQVDKDKILAKKIYSEMNNECIKGDER